MKYNFNFNNIRLVKIYNNIQYWNKVIISGINHSLKISWNFFFSGKNVLLSLDCKTNIAFTPSFLSI